MSAAIFLVFVFAGGLSASAQTTTTLPNNNIVDVGFPCPDGTFKLGDCQPNTNIPNYLNNLYKFAVGIAGLLALGMIVAGGVYYTVSSGSSDKQKEAKDMITSALLGVALILASYLILNTINPEMTKLNLDFTDIEGNKVNKLDLKNSGKIETNSAACPKFSTINIYPAVDGKLGKTCQFRKNITNNNIEINNEDGYYNDDSLGLTAGTSIAAGAFIWTYPYYKSGGDPASARCLIYAYREPNSPSSTEMITLDNSLSVCAPQQTPNLSCEQWTFSALESQTETGQKSVVSRSVDVNDNFNYPNISTPPSIIKLPWKDMCYSTFCTDRSWDCTKLRQL